MPKMTKSEAGKLGGAATKKKMLERDPDYYQTIGTIGGHAMVQKHGKEFYAQLGRMSPKQKEQR